MAQYALYAGKETPGEADSPFPETSGHLRGRKKSTVIGPIDQGKYQAVRLTSTPCQFFGRAEFQSLLDDLLLTVLTDHREDFSNIKPAVFIDTREVAGFPCERI